MEQLLAFGGYGPALPNRSLDDVESERAREVRIIVTSIRILILATYLIQLSENERNID